MAYEPNPPEQEEELEIVMQVFAVFNHGGVEPQRIEIRDTPEVTPAWLAQQHQNLKTWTGFSHIEVRTLETFKVY